MYICAYTGNVCTYVLIQAMYVHMCLYRQCMYICAYTGHVCTYVPIQAMYVHMCLYRPCMEFKGKLHANLQINIKII